jgi:hypothetical protein
MHRIHTSEKAAEIGTTATLDSVVLPPKMGSYLDTDHLLSKNDNIKKNIIYGYIQSM